MRRQDKDPYLPGYPMRPEWGEPHPRDPNWRDGEYHGHRLHYDHRYGAYGMHRREHEYDLGGHGGFDGIYDEGPGGFDRHGVYHHPYFQGRVRHPHSERAAPHYDLEYRHELVGGIRRDTRYLRQYNAHSPELDRGDDHGFGWAPERDGFRPDAPGGRGGPR